MPASCTIGAACLLLAFCAHAGALRMSLMMDVKTHQSRSTFEPSRDHPDEDWFYLTQATEDVEYEMRLNMSGQKEQAQKGRTQVSEVPGVTEGVSGYKRARIETFGNEVSLVIETKLVRKKKQEGKDVDEKEENVQRILLEFKSRSAKAADLKGQKPVELRITRTGLNNLLGDAKAKTESGINAKASGEGTKVSISGFSRLLDSGRKGAVFVSANRIQYEAPPMRVHGEGKVKVPGAGPD